MVHRTRLFRYIYIRFEWPVPSDAHHPNVPLLPKPNTLMNTLFASVCVFFVILPLKSFAFACLRRRAPGSRLATVPPFTWGPPEPLYDRATVSVKYIRSFLHSRITATAMAVLEEHPNRGGIWGEFSGINNKSTVVLALYTHALTYAALSLSLSLSSIRY